jgi:hypothetical protein
MASAACCMPVALFIALDAAGSGINGANTLAGAAVCILIFLMPILLILAGCFLWQPVDKNAKFSYALSLVFLVLLSAALIFDYPAVEHFFKFLLAAGKIW